MKKVKITRIAIAGLAVATMGLAACGDDNSSSNDTTEVSEETELTISGEWARTSPAATTMGAAYMTIVSPIDDALISASVDSSVAETVELHEMVMADSMMSDEMSDDMSSDMGDDSMSEDMDHSSMSGDDMSGEMKMQQVMRIELPAGTPVALEPGGYHIMLIGLVNPLETGQTITVTLTFENAGEVVVEVPVQEEAP